MRCLLLANTAAAVAVCAVLNSPRLNQSLWGDEEYSLKKAIVGEYGRSADDEIVFDRREWRDTFFNYRSPNNHVLYSVLARLSNAAFGRTSPDPADPRGNYFSELALRLPAFVAGLGAVATAAWFTASLGFPRAALAVVWLLALHPWFVRYSTEARGYAVVFLCAPAALACLLAALRSGRWRWWAGFGLAQFLTFYTYPGTVYFVVMANLAALVSVATAPGGKELRTRQLWRWVTASGASAMAVVGLMAPLFPQLRDYLGRDLARGAMGSAWLADASAYLSTGMAWRAWEPANPLCHAWQPVATAHPVTFWGGAAVLAAVYLAGVAHLVTASQRARTFALAIVLPPILTYLHNAAAGTYLFLWYLVPALPFIAVVWAVGLYAMARAAPAGRSRDLAWAGVTLAFLAAFGSATAGQRRAFRQHPFEPLRESAALTRAVTNPEHPGIEDVITLGFHMIGRGYDPAVRVVRSVEELESWLVEADASGRPLWVQFAQPDLAEVFHPEIMAALRDRTRFEPAPPLWGMDVQCTRLHYRYLGKSAGDPPR
jgi:hypothetical protein